jgi:ferrous iron transport protein B
LTRENKTIAIIGNVGVGKTALFEQLYRGAVRSRKVPGCRVELSEALLSGDPKDRFLSWWSRFFRSSTEETGVQTGFGPGPEMIPRPGVAPATLVDTPGVAFLFNREDDECTTRDFLMADQVDVLVVVADAKNLRRSLVLFLQAAEFQLPTVLVLNMTDEAQQLGLEFNLERLAEALTVELSPVVAIEGRVLKRLTALFERAKVPSVRIPYPKEVASALETLARLLKGAPISSRALGLLLLVDDRRARKMLEEEVGLKAANRAREVVRKAKEAFQHPLDMIIADALYDEAGRIAKQVTRQAPPGRDVLQRLGHYASHPLLGLPIASLIMLAGYFWVGVLGAGIVVDYLDRKLFHGLLLPLCERLLGDLPWTFAREAILDPNFGLLPTALFLAFGIVLPVLFFFYIFFGLLEDSGYLSRLSVLMDRSLRHLGLTGQGIMPLVFGFSCITMAILATRMLKTRKERIISTFLLLLGFPCAPLLAVMMVVLEPFPWTAAATLFGLLFLQVLVAGVVANALLPGGDPDFILELTPIRIPRFRVVLNRARQLSWLFLREALPAFIVASFALFLLDRFGGLEALQRLSRPVVEGMLGLPDQAVQVFLKTMIRRENGAAELTLVQDHFNSLQSVVTLFVMTLIVPCVNSAIVLLKEQGIKICVLLLLLVGVYAVAAGTGLNWVCQALGITFS